MEVFEITEKLRKEIQELMGGDEFGGLGELVRLGKKATPQLIQMLEHSDPLMRKRAAIALGRIRDRTALTPLVNSLSDKNPTVVISVIDALASLDVKKVSQNIVPFLKNSDPSVRVHAARALGNLKAKKSKAYLAELCEKEEHDLIRKEAAKALRNIENP